MHELTLDATTPIPGRGDLPTVDDIGSNFPDVAARAQEIARVYTVLSRADEAARHNQIVAALALHYEHKWKPVQVCVFAGVTRAAFIGWRRRADTQRPPEMAEDTAKALLARCRDALQWVEPELEAFAAARIDAVNDLVAAGYSKPAIAALTGLSEAMVDGDRRRAIRAGRAADRPAVHPGPTAVAVAAHIADGRWQPGAPLPSEHDLAATFGVPRTTLNYTLRRLADEGLVYSRGRYDGGWFVADAPDPAVVARIAATAKPAPEPALPAAV